MASNCASNIKEEVPEVLINYCTIQCLLSGNFITSRFVSLPKHLLIRRSNLLSRLPRFIRKLSKMEYIWVIQNGGSKKADCSSYLFQKWATSSWHHCYCLKLLMLTCWLYHKAFFLFIYFFFFSFKATSREIWISAKNSTKWRQITSLCKSNYT